VPSTRSVTTTRTRSRPTGGTSFSDSSVWLSPLPSIHVSNKFGVSSRSVSGGSSSAVALFVDALVPSSL
jgi:hypothetical protein